MIDFTTAMALAPTFVALIEAVLAKVAPELEAEVAKFAPTAGKVAQLLTAAKDPDDIKALILAEQYRCIDALVAAQIAKSSG